MTEKSNMMSRLRAWWLRMRCPTEFLCDNCQLDYGNLCTRPQRPNAVKCPDYTPK